MALRDTLAPSIWSGSHFSFKYPFASHHHLSSSPSPRRPCVLRASTSTGMSVPLTAHLLSLSTSPPYSAAISHPFLTAAGTGAAAQRDTLCISTSDVARVWLAVPEARRICAEASGRRGRVDVPIGSWKLYIVLRRGHSNNHRAAFSQGRKMKGSPGADRRAKAADGEAR